MSRKEAGFVAGAAAFTGFEGARPWNAELISAAPAKFTLNGSLLEAAAAAAGCEKAKASSRELAVLKEKGSAAAGAGAGVGVGAGAAGAARSCGRSCEEVKVTSRLGCGDRSCRSRSKSRRLLHFFALIS